MVALLPYLFALLIADGAGDGVRARWPLAGWSAIGIALVGTLVGWAALCAVANTVVARSGRHRALVLWDWLAQALMLAWFAWLCLGWGWPRWVPGQAAAVVPFAAMLCVHWFFLAVGARGVTGLEWTRRAMLLHQLRFSALPLLLGLTAVTDVARLVELRIHAPHEVVLGVIALEATMLLVLVLIPAVMVRMWGARPLEAGPLRDRLRAACDAMGVRVRTLMHWPMPGGRVYNAAVLGVVPRLRYVLFTDDLLRDFEDRHLMAVLGHELGHARHHHLWIYFLFANTVMSVAWLANQVHALAISSGWLQPAPALGDLGDVVMGILLLVMVWRFAFGWLSRGCERQADLAGVALAGDASAMEEALKTVARLSGQPEDAPNWRHYSIAQRVAFLRSVHADPAIASQHHRRMRFSLILLLVVMVASLALNWYLNPLSRAAATADPAAELVRWEERDPSLHAAISRADAGDPGEFATWFQRASQPQRQQVAALIQEIFIRPDADPALLYRQRHRLTAMSGLDTGNVLLNLGLDNTLAYILVASPQPPSATDREQARGLLPSLEQAVAAEPNHGILDTIGCVHYQLGNLAKARDAFANALDALSRDRRVDLPERGGIESLYRRRLDAANSSIRAVAGGGQPVPLPLEKGEQLPAAAPPPQAPVGPAPSGSSEPAIPGGAETA